MNALGTFDRTLLKKILAVPTASYQEEEVQNFITNYIIQIGNKDIDLEIDNMGNFYITKGHTNKGEHYPCFVAHMDGALDFVRGKIVLTVPKQNTLIGFDTVKNEQCYLAADDLVGVFIALSALRTLPVVKVAFFVAEEVGCVGSRGADMEFFKDCGYVLQSDRRGNNDVIFNASGTIMASKKFKSHIKETMKAYGMAFAQGSMTDVMQLKENGLDVCALNISSAYFNPHTDNEYVDVKALQNIYSFIGALVTTLGNKKWAHKPEGKSYMTYSYNGWRPKGGSTSQLNNRYDPYYDDYYGEDWDWEHISRPVNDTTIGIGKTFEQISHDLKKKKIIFDFKEPKDQHENCIECGKPRPSHNNYLCKQCIEDYNRIGISNPDRQAL